MGAHLCILLSWPARAFLCIEDEIRTHKLGLATAASQRNISTTSMRFLTIAALAATLLLAEEPKLATAPSDPGHDYVKTEEGVKPSDPNKLSPAHQATYREVVEDVKAINAELQEKELAMYRAKDAYEKAAGVYEKLMAQAKEVKQPALAAKVKKIQTEANCPDCNVSADMKWVRPVAPASK